MKRDYYREFLKRIDQAIHRFIEHAKATDPRAWYVGGKSATQSCIKLFVFAINV